MAGLPPARHDRLSLCGSLGGLLRLALQPELARGVGLKGPEDTNARIGGPTQEAIVLRQSRGHIPEEDGLHLSIRGCLQDGMGVGEERLGGLRAQRNRTQRQLRIHIYAPIPCLGGDRGQARFRQAHEDTLGEHALNADQRSGSIVTRFDQLSGDPVRMIGHLRPFLINLIREDPLPRYPRKRRGGCLPAMLCVLPRPFGHSLLDILSLHGDILFADDLRLELALTHFKILLCHDTLR